MTERERWTRLHDAGLVERVRNPIDRPEQEAALDEIMRRYQKAMSNACVYQIADLDRVADVVQDSVEAATRALVRGHGPAEPDKLRAWLCGIVRNRCLEDHRRRSRETPSPLETLAADETDADLLRRTDEVFRLLDIVAATFTLRQRRIYQFHIRQQLHGKALATALSISAKSAHKLAYENKIRVEEGIGALLLAKHGRPHCPQLAAILDRSGWDGKDDEQFSGILRQRIIRHLGTCRKCDNCGTCEQRRVRLKAGYAPVLIPILIAPELTESIPEIIRRVLDEEEERERNDKQDGVKLAAAGAVLVTAASKPQQQKDHWIVDGILNLLKVLVVLVLIATLGPKFFPDLFDKLNLPNNGNSATVRMAVFVPAGYTVYVSPPGVTCTPTANCDLKYRRGTSVTLTARRGQYVSYQGPLSWTGCTGSGNSCTFVPTGSARVCLVEPGYAMPWNWCRGTR